jgi:hypothetical protein
LLDYILQRSLPEDLSDSILVSGTDSNIIFFKTNLSKLKGKKGNERDTAKGIIKLTRKFCDYALKQYNFIGINCYQHHFIVVNCKFDINTMDIFSDVRIYDSVHISV